MMLKLALITLSWAVLVCGLFEDQVGKFDWKHTYVGKLKFAEFDSAKRILVGTEENVVASLHVKNGHVAWRHVLEPEHSLELLHLTETGQALSVSGDGSVYYVRGWDTTHGTLEFEWTIQPLAEQKVPSVSAKWLVAGDRLLHVVPVPGSHLEVSSYRRDTGQNSGSTLKVSTGWVRDLEKCALAGEYFACLSDRELVMLDVTKESPMVYKKLLEHLIGNVSGDVQIVASKQDKALLLRRNNVYRKVILQDNDAFSLPYGFQSEFVSVQNGDENMLIEITPSKEIRTVYVEDNHEETVEIQDGSTDGPLAPVAGICRGQACRLLVKGADDSITLLQLPTGKTLWTREEALSNVLALKFVELPLSEMDASIELEFTNTGDILGTLFRRLSSQIRQVASWFSAPKHVPRAQNLIRDDFGFHKLIIAATKVGKIYALDSTNGQIVWAKFLGDIKPFQRLDRDAFRLFEQRNARYHPLSPVCTLLAKDALTDEAILYSFDPLTGEAEDTVKLGFKVRQSMLMPFEDHDRLKSVILMSDSGDVYVHPKSVGALSGSNLFMYSADADKGQLHGYALQMDQHLNAIKARRTWELRLGPAKIIALGCKSSVEKVHSQGRVLSDRSVLYKYVNPNLLAVAALSPDPLHKNVLSVYLIDGVTGLIVYSVNHKRARGPVKLVHSENWIVYSYLNEKFRRVEIAAVELYEGITQSNETAFSSFALSQLPHAETQAYILPASPRVLTTTLTERGITNKHLLLALSSGHVAELPWAVLEPRGSQLAAGPEEGYIPYIPELPLPPEAFINYNQTLERVNGIYVSPARLESTSLVLVYGLDLFYTRVAPSKTFDVLKEDFDHWLIVTVLSGLVVASYLTKYLAARKALKQAWR